MQKMKLTNDAVIIDKLNSDVLYPKEQVKILLEGLSDILYELIKYLLRARVVHCS